VFSCVKETVTKELMHLIEMDRSGEQVDRALLHAAVTLYVEMGVDTFRMYTNDFEVPLLASTAVFYQKQAQLWLETDSCPEYLRKAEVRIAQERRRLKDYLHPSSEKKLFETLYKVLLVDVQRELLNKDGTGCQTMLAERQERDLSRMYNLYNLVPASLPFIAEMLKTHIIGDGTKLIEQVNAQKTATSFVSELMKTHDKYLSLVFGCFQANNIFQRALTEAFEKIVNTGTDSCPTAELLADFADGVLKKGGSKLEAKELEDTLDNTVRIFSYLSDKDLFSEFYRKLLAKRLLMQNSDSVDTEKSIIGKLKLKCGAQYTSKLEGMIVDMRTAQDHAQEFHAFMRDRNVDLGGIDFAVQTLTSGYWPTYQAEPLKLPVSMQKCIDSFVAFYSSKTDNRVLKWIHRLGQVTMTGNFTRNKIDLVVSAVQAAILLLFNEFDQLTIQSIIDHTGLEADAVKVQLRSLVSGQFKILVKVPEKGYDVKHTMRVNKSFWHNHRRIKIPNAMARTTTKDKAQANRAVQEDRRHAIEASIVRVMKTRKTLDHQNLVLEVVSHLSQFFKPDPRQIKIRIQDLIEREYLKRDGSKSNLYHYVA